MRSKVERLHRHNSGAELSEPRFVDLFAGCGGITLGFKRAGAKPLGGIESDVEAAKTYARNFHSDVDGGFHLHSEPRDITKVTPEGVLSEWGVDDPITAVDLVVGGPPCPAYARIGRAKLREIAKHPRAHKHDPRAKLYVPYLRFVEALAPVALVMENVPEIMNFGGHNLAEEICEALEVLGYKCAYTLLNAANYGVPQTRERFFLIAIHAATGVDPNFPLGTHAVELPVGYRGTRAHALKAVRSAVTSTRFVESPGTIRNAARAVTVRQALSDLPVLFPEDRRSAGRRGIPDDLGYGGGGRPSRFAADMRRWPGFQADRWIRNHATRRLTERDYRIFRRMKPGADYPSAVAIATRLFEARLRGLDKRNEGLRPGTNAYSAEYKAFVPPYDVAKFPNKWRKMEPDRPARTLMAHLGKDAYSHIHFDSRQGRTISVREAARLQSFPDGFAFPETLNAAFRQIGNSVPPLLAFALAKHLIKLIGWR